MMSCGSLPKHTLVDLHENDMMARPSLKESSSKNYNKLLTFFG